MTGQQHIQVTVNGQPRDIAAGSTILDLLADLGIAPGQVAIERNRQLVRREQHGETVLQDGDQLEVVTFFGGG
jgi:sulfur carrier protein